MITKKEIEEARKLLRKAENPLFLYDNDPDGLCSYVLLRKYVGMKGHGYSVQGGHPIDDKVMHKIEEYQPDLIVILDKPVVMQSFLDKMHVPVIWMDHHPLLKRKRVHYYNPLNHNEHDNRPTTTLAYAVTEQNLWIATVGAVYDWHTPDYIEKFKKSYPGYLGKEKEPGTIRYTTRLGELVLIFVFMIKGKSAEVKKSVDALFKIENPEEILNQTSEAGKYIWKKAQKQKKEYDKLLKEARKAAKKKDKILLFLYPSTQTSYTSELANQLIHENPDKLIILGREKGGEFKVSFRSTKLNIPEILEKALLNVKGYGGGHKHSCGGAIAEEDFNTFIENIRAEL